MKRILLHAYRSTVPRSFRAWFNALPLVSAIRRKLLCEDTALHDELYDERYYDAMASLAADSAEPIAADLVELFNPVDVLDVGCGCCDYLSVFKRHGIRAYGVDLSEAGLARCRRMQIEVLKHDLTAVQSLPWRVDLVYSFEVAEHLLPKFAERYVQKLTDAARRHVVITAANPGQQGLNHFNCQPKDYWVRLFDAQDFEYLKDLTADWERRNRDRRLAPWFAENMLVFKRASSIHAQP